MATITTIKKPTIIEDFGNGHIIIWLI